jgi:hypothetical protein
MPRATFWRAWPVWAGQRRSSRWGARMTVRTLRWAACCVAAVSVALLVGGAALSYADRHLVPASSWDFSSVFEEATFMAIPAVGFVQATWERGRLDLPGGGPGGRTGFFCWRYGQRGLVAAPGSLPAAREAAWFVNLAWAIPIAGLAFMLLLFPTGRLRPPTRCDRSCLDERPYSQPYSPNFVPRGTQVAMRFSHGPLRERSMTRRSALAPVTGLLKAWPTAR